MAWYERTGNPHFPYLFFSSLALGQLGVGLYLGGQYFLKVFVFFAVGTFSWSFLEYFIHRVLLHVPLNSGRWDYLSRLTHWRHHEQPQDPELVALPPGVAIPLYLFFCGLAWVTLHRWEAVLGWTAGLAFGYALYERIHFVVHLHPPKSSLMGYLRRHHYRHHFQDPQSCFGISSPCWDWVFGTFKARFTSDLEKSS
jgi:sterol desaturase/sphingolipid hydroxylase (fatty acid hydroxylase superfamily)